MQEHNFEDRIKSAFEHHRPETDNDAIWINIEPHLKKKKKRRFIIFFFGVLGLGLLLFFGRNGVWKQAHPATVSNNKSILTPSVGESEQAAIHSRSAENQVAPGQVQSVTTDNNTSSSTVQSAKGTIAPPVARSGVTAIDGTAKTVVSPADIKQSTSASAPNLIPIAAETAHTIAQYSSIPRAEATASAPKDGKTADIPARELLLIPTFDQWIAASGDTLPPYPSLVGKPVPVIQEGKTANDAAKLTAKTTPKKNDKPDPRKKSKKRKSRWEENLSLQAGPAYAFKRLTQNKNIYTPAEYLQSRKDSEHSMESFTAGFYYSATTRKGLVLKTGLDYRQSNEKFYAAYSTKETKEVNGVVSITVDGAGNAIEQTNGLKTITTTTEYSNTAYNHYRYVNWPVGIGYRHTGKKNRWEISGGVDFNLIFRANATLYATGGYLTTIKHSNTFYDNIFSNNTKTGLWTAFAYDWRLTDHLRWQLGANMQLPLSPVTNPDYSLVQRYFNVGMQVGMIYQVQVFKKSKKAK